MQCCPFDGCFPGMSVILLSNLLVLDIGIRNAFSRPGGAVAFPIRHSMVPFRF